MKKATIFILSSVVLALAALYVISLFVDDKKNPWVKLGLGKSDDANKTITLAPKDYTGVKKQVILSREQTLYPDEIELLQRWINLYDNANTVLVNGIFDEFTETAVNRITGKTSTTLQEFRFVWLVNKRLDTEADLIQKGER